MRQLVQSGQGRLHVAEDMGDGTWRGVCGCVVLKPKAVLPTDWDALLGDAPACRYCAAVADAVRFERILAEQAVQDAQLDAQARRDGSVDALQRRDAA